MSEIEKMQRYINRTKLDKDSRYCLSFAEAAALGRGFFDDTDSAFDIIVLAFNYGKAKGYRAAKAKMKGAVLYE